MAKETGLAWSTLSVDDAAAAAQDIKNDITNFNFGTPRAVQDWTGVDKSAFERGLLLADFTITMAGAFNDAANRAHAVFKTISSTSVQRTVALGFSGQTLNNECVLTDYALTRAQSGELTWSVPGSLADGTPPAWS